MKITKSWQKIKKEGCNSQKGRKEGKKEGKGRERACVSHVCED